MNIEIANRLVNLRKAHGYSQEELAEKLGLSRQAVSKWERAESSPDTDNLIMLSRLYGVSLDELLSTEDEIPMPEEAPAGGAPARDGVHVSFTEGINVTDEDGSRVHIGWDGIHVNDASDGESVHIGGDEPEVDDDPDWIGSYINDIEVDGDGVTFTQNGERRHEPWNRVKDGKKSFVHKVRSEKTGKWRTTVVTENGRKVVIDTNREPSEDQISSNGVTVTSESSSSGFPYAVLVTGVFLLLGFLKQWWHPAWVLFLTIPIYYTIAQAVKRRKILILDVIVPVAVTGAYVALGMIYKIWHPLWLMLLAIPIYYAISLAIRKDYGKGSAATGVYSLVVIAAYIALGVTFRETAWTVGWLLFLTIPMFGSIVQSIRKKRSFGSALRHFPWELVIVAGYLFVGLMFGVWHPTWVAFLFIPVWRWLLGLTAKKKDSSSVIDAEEADDDDDEDDD